MTSRRKRTRRPASKRPSEPASEVAGKLASPRPARIPVRSAIELTDEERSTLCIKTFVSLRTIESFAAGFPVHRTTKLRLEQAMQKEGITKRPRKPGSGRRRRVTTVNTPGETAEARPPRPKPLRSELQGTSA